MALSACNYEFGLKETNSQSDLSTPAGLAAVFSIQDAFGVHLCVSLLDQGLFTKSPMLFSTVDPAI